MKEKRLVARDGQDLCGAERVRPRRLGLARGGLGHGGGAESTCSGEMGNLGGRFYGGWLQRRWWRLVARWIGKLEMVIGRWLVICVREDEGKGEENGCAVSDAGRRVRHTKRDYELMVIERLLGVLVSLSTPIAKAVVSIKFSVSDVKSKYKDATLLPKWKAFQTVIFLERDDGLRDSSKIAAFDFDGCLAKTDVKRVGANAWDLMHSSIPDKLQSLHNDGYKLVIFTNESNIERWKNKRQVAVDSKIGRLNNFIEKVKVPVQVFIACGVGLKPGKTNKNEDDAFRKPKPGMWHLMEQHFNSGIVIDMDQSFYVGDAAGRKSDHSDADIKFAEAIGLKFYVPEEYFV
ncbi:unnamed protein product [Sphenostylis stenocarpa]|uniref:Uncharacterized protein n=1 Tax=Sphenostylis stenocarpa TaxID=92480 RepID=A0AA86W4T9_9FABA|nr:unnamed protein product [Sphenostylis stenocarpa]